VSLSLEKNSLALPFPAEPYHATPCLGVLITGKRYFRDRENTGVGMPMIAITTGSSTRGYLSLLKNPTPVVADFSTGVGIWAGYGYKTRKVQ